MKHSELPWWINKLYKGGYGIGSGKDLYVAEVDGKSDNAEANAQFIVKACNNHQMLVDMVRELGRELSILVTGEHSSLVKARKLLSELEED